MDVIFTHGAGLDVQKKTVMACRVTPEPTGRQADGVMELKELGTMTVDLRALSDWLVEAGITPVAMESTGEYWKPVYHILEGDFTVFLVNAAPATQEPGRKTDQSEARWLAKLMRHGLVQASFIPPVAGRAARLAGSDTLPPHLGAGTQPRGQPRARSAGAGQHQAGLGGDGHDGPVGASDLECFDRGTGRPRHDGRVGPRADAEQDPPPGAGPDRAGPRPSPPVAGAAVGPYRFLGRTARHPER
jgi:Transposase